MLPVKAACFGRWVAVVTLISGVLARLFLEPGCAGQGSNLKVRSAATASLEPRFISQASGSGPRKNAIGTSGHP